MVSCVDYFARNTSRFQEIGMEKIKTIKRGQLLMSAGEIGPVWRVSQGVFRIERVGLDGLSLVQLGLPGDLLGVESLCAEPYAYSVTAITTGVAKLQAVNGDLSKFGVVAKAYLQQQRRTYDMMKLRGGPVKDRLAHFLMLLARNEDGTQRELDRSDLPVLKDIAAILDITTETVCRELKAFLPAREHKKQVSEAWLDGAEMAIAA
jgi:CRP-like cAMP-binding protein